MGLTLWATHRRTWRECWADREPAPRVAAAEALARFGDASLRRDALAALLATADYHRDGNQAAMLALDVIVALGDIAGPIRADAAAVPEPGHGGAGA